ncbi:hypothetical protein [Lacticigenium naphthae]|nr:hypothetical protein [Lacticigenium naphthae]
MEADRSTSLSSLAEVARIGEDQATLVEKRSEVDQMEVNRSTPPSRT